MVLAKIGLGGVDSIGMAQDRDKWRALKAIMNLWVLQNARKLSNGYTTDGISTSAQLHRVS
jgi:hypothetical protein